MRSLIKLIASSNIHKHPLLNAPQKTFLVLRSKMGEINLSRTMLEAKFRVSVLWSASRPLTKVLISIIKGTSWNFRGSCLHPTECIHVYNSRVCDYRFTHLQSPTPHWINCGVLTWDIGQGSAQRETRHISLSVNRY